MERTDVLELMSALKLYGMRAAYDEVMSNGIKRRHDPPRIVGDLLAAEIAEKQARSIKYQLTIAKLPLAKDLDQFDFAGTPINEALIHELAGGGFLAEQRNAVLIGGTGTGKSHLAIAIARACIRGSARGRFYTVVDLVNRLESEARDGRQGRLAEYLTRMDSLRRGGNCPLIASIRHLRPFRSSRNSAIRPTFHRWTFAKGEIGGDDRDRCGSTGVIIIVAARRVGDGCQTAGNRDFVVLDELGYLPFAQTDPGADARELRPRDLVRRLRLEADGASIFSRRTGAAGAIASTRGLRADWPAGAVSGTDDPLTGGFEVNSASAAWRARVIRSRSSP